MKDEASSGDSGVRIGDDVLRTSPKVSWDDINSAFQNRIRSGVIANYGHLNITNFMSVAKDVFKSKISVVSNKHSSIKASAKLVVNYILQKDEEQKTEIKYFFS